MKEQTKDQKDQAAPVPAPTPQVSAPVDPHMEELKDLAFRYGRATMLAVAVFLVVGVPIFMVRNHRDSAKSKASALLSSAAQPGDLANIVKDYPDTPAAPVALLHLARTQYDQQDYAKAQSSYEDFLSRFATHELAPVAKLGKAHCLEGKGMTEEALKSFETFLSSNKGHFLTPQALMAKARCLYHLKKEKEAQIVIEDFLVANPKSPWKPHAEEMLEEFKRPPVAAATKIESLIPATGTNAPLPSLLAPPTDN